jgi:hypothetical protein
MRVVPALDELECMRRRERSGFESRCIDPLALESGKEGLTHRVVVAVGHRASRRANANRFTAPAERD